ncbi:MAG: hypothetical protein PHX27_04285 [Candidatus ainarchaeum sp.]|nr:hypothetical protein [Candidatus ainarchaeum sp.]
MKKLFLILIILIGIIFSLNNIFALTTIVDVNIQSVNVPTWQDNCPVTHQLEKPYIKGFNHYLELTDADFQYVAGTQLNMLSAHKSLQKIATFAFERDIQKIYNLRISILPLRQKAYFRTENIVGGTRTCLWNFTGNINCELNRSEGTRDFLEVTTCSPSSGNSYGCDTGKRDFPEMSCYTNPSFLYDLEITRNCTTPLTQDGIYAYPQMTYTYRDWNASAEKFYDIVELDPAYPQRYCIEIGQIN